MRYWRQAAILAIACLTWVGSAILFGMPNTPWEVVRPFITSMSVASVCVGIYDKWAWSWPVFHGNLTQRPNLKGVWRMKLVSTWTDSDGNNIPPIQGYAQIDQSSDTFCLRIYTPKSSSETIAYAFKLDQKVYRLAIVYENEPNIDLRDTGSPYHKGSAVFKIRGRYPKTFMGDYWTERKSSGTITLSERIHGEINSFEEGTSLFTEVD